MISVTDRHQCTESDESFIRYVDFDLKAFEGIVFHASKVGNHLAN